MYKTAVIKDLAFNESGLLRLPRDLLDRLAFHLPPNDVALGLRLASRTLAAALCQPHHATIHLSHPVDLRAFAARWGCPGATQRLTLRQRLALLRLTSASGVLPNFLLLHKQRSFHRLSQRFDRERLWLDDSESSWWEDWEKPLDLCLKAAAGAGRLQMCRQLLQPGFLYGWCHDTEEVAGAASSAGHQEVVHLLLDAYKAAGGTPDLSVAALVGSVELGMEALTSCLSCLCAALRIAAKRGDEAMVEWLLQQQGHPGLEEWRLDEVGLAQAVAESCGLPYLQHLLVRWYRGQEGEGGAAAAAAAGQQLGSRKEAFQAALRGAAGSPKPDWKGKVEWLLQQDERQLLGVLAGQCKRDACIAAARCTDAAERLRWLAQQGFAVGCSKVACEAIAHGRTAAVEYLLDEQGVVLEREAGTEAVEQAALKGHLPVLQVLHERRYGMFSLAVERAVDRGHVEVVRWLLSVLPGPPSRHLSANAFTHAVLWEDWPMLQLLLRARCPLPLERQLAEGADPTEETLAWLADRGCCYSTLDVLNAREDREEVEAARSPVDPDKERRAETWERRHLERRRQRQRQQRQRQGAERSAGGRQGGIGARGKEKRPGAAPGRQAVIAGSGDGASTIGRARGPGGCGRAAGQGGARQSCSAAERRRQARLDALWAFSEG